MTRHGLTRFAAAAGLSAALLGASASSAFSEEQGCNSHHTRNGAVIGGILGGVIGNLAGGRHDKGLSTMFGAAAGAALGGAIGSQLDEEDCQKFIAATQRTLETGEDTHWQGQEAYGETHITDNHFESRTQDVQVYRDVDEVPPLEIVGGHFVAVASGNVRSGPGTDYNVIGQIQKGQRVDVIGKVKGQPWYMIGEGGVGTGYVSTSWVVKATTQASPRVSAAKPAPDKIKTVSAATETNCAAVHQTVTMRSGQTQSQDIHACKNPDGTWTTV